ncbi:MAG: ATP synthase F0 subunit C [Bdellovibrionales bacterium]
MKKMNVATALVATMTALPAFAQEAHAATGGGDGLIGVGVGLTLGLAALGGTFGQGKAVAAAMDGISRNPSAQPKMFIPLILGLALMESLVVLSWLIAGQLIGKM